MCLAIIVDSARGKEVTLTLSGGWLPHTSASSSFLDGIYNNFPPDPDWLCSSSSNDCQSHDELMAVALQKIGVPDPASAPGTLSLTPNATLPERNGRAGMQSK